MVHSLPKFRGLNTCDGAKSAPSSAARRGVALAARAAAGVAGERVRESTREHPDPRRHGREEDRHEDRPFGFVRNCRRTGLDLGFARHPAQPDPEPMIFFLAKGERDACGPGCSEWIAAEGMFEGPQVERRFRDLLTP